MLASLELSADFSRGCMLSMIRPALLLTHPHPAILGSPRMHLPGPSVNKGILGRAEAAKSPDPPSVRLTATLGYWTLNFQVLF
jgi:hypothetical protein